MFGDIEENEDESEVVVEYGDHETPMYEMSQDNINSLLMFGIKMIMVDFHPPRINQALEVILTGQYINRDGSGMV